VLLGDAVHLGTLLQENGAEAVRFDAIVGRNVLSRGVDNMAVLAQMSACLRPGGRLVWSEILPAQAQRLSALVDLNDLGPALAARLQAAEATIYTASDHPQVNWGVAELEAALRATGFTFSARLQAERYTEDRRLPAALLARWFALPEASPRPTYAQHLRLYLSAAELAQVQTCFQRQLSDQVVPWHSTLVHITAAKL
jgi:putative ATPase